MYVYVLLMHATIKIKTDFIVPNSLPKPWGRRKLDFHVLTGNQKTLFIQSLVTIAALLIRKNRRL